MADRQFHISRTELFDQLKSSSYNMNSERILVDYLKAKFNLNDCSEPMLKELKRLMHSYMVSVSQCWKKCARNKTVFLNKNSSWINTIIVIPNIDLTSSAMEVQETPKRGRPEKIFQDLSCKSKRRKLNPLIEQRSLSELTFATKCKLNQAGKRDAAKILENLVNSPKRATCMKKAYESNAQTNKCSGYTADEALALIVATKLTKRRYQILRSAATQKDLKQLYPSYRNILAAKKACYPPAEDMTITEAGASIKLQSLVDLTIKRLCIVQHEVLKKFCGSDDYKLNNLKILFKWGVDGSGGQSRYKQKLDVETSDDSYVFASSLVPLQMEGRDADNKVYVLWKNPKMSSTSYCRPINFRFIKETEEEIQNEFKFVRDQIKTLTTTQIQINNTTIEVSAFFEETMVDGKVANALASNRSTQRCYICHATAQDMNNLAEVKKRPINKTTLSFGLSTLHAQIRLMECVLHIAYRLNFKKWQARTEEEKTKLKAKKKFIIDKFRSETGMLLDTPKQGGGNTNDGNSARRFFKNTDISSRITGINKELIDRFSVILRTITCDYEIQNDKFEKYCNETAQLYVSLYGWYPMPATLHKILIHGPSIIKSFLVPIGYLSEDVQESRHKEFRKIRLEFARKTTREDTNSDIIHNLLITSDPVITALKPGKELYLKTISQDVLNLIKAPDIIESPFVAYSDSDTSDSE